MSKNIEFSGHDHIGGHNTLVQSYGIQQPVRQLRTGSINERPECQTSQTNPVLGQLMNRWWKEAESRY